MPITYRRFLSTDNPSGRGKKLIPARARKQLELIDFLSSQSEPVSKQRLVAKWV